jgi:hypothetical protein
MAQRAAKADQDARSLPSRDHRERSRARVLNGAVLRFGHN